MSSLLCKFNASNSVNQIHTKFSALIHLIISIGFKCQGNGLSYGIPPHFIVNGSGKYALKSSLSL